MLSTSLVLMGGVNSVIASTGVDFGTTHTSTHHLGWSQQALCGLDCATKRIASNTVPASEFSRLSITHLASPDIHLSPEFQLAPLTDMMPSNAFMSLSIHSQLAPAGAPRQRASGQHPSAANRWLTASVCFISDTGACSGMGGAGGESYPTGGGPDWDNDSAKRCINDGYVSKPCPAGQEAYGVCPYNSNYAVECKCRTDLQECTKPYYGDGAECGGKYESCVVDYDKACKEDNPEFTNTCASGWQVDPNDLCQYSSSYGTCCN